MKKYFSILSLVLMFVCCNCVFTSCSKDDDDDVKEGVDMALVGTWENIDEEKDCREVMTFFADGTHLDALYSVVTTDDPKYTDENGAYKKSKGTYTASNGVLTISLTHEFSVNKYNDKEWHEKKDVLDGSVNYQVKDDKLTLSGVNNDGKEKTLSLTKVK